MLRDKPKPLYCEACELEYAPGRCPHRPEPKPTPKRELSTPVPPFGPEDSDTDEERRLWPLKP